MDIVRRISFYLNNWRSLANRILIVLSPIIPDSPYLKIKYLISLGVWPNLKEPKTFSEKIQWLKIHDKKNEYAKMVDKYAVKEYISDCIGQKYIIPTLAVWDEIEKIDITNLPNKFVLKSTFSGGGGGVFICNDKGSFDLKKIKTLLRKNLKHNLGLHNREWPYAKVPKRFIAEKFMEDESSKELKDYKFFCFNGEPKLCQVISNRSTSETIDFYDMDWNHIPGLVGLNLNVVNSIELHNKPKSFDEMKMIARKLALDIPFVRIDLYEINGECYFGEITFYPASGFGLFRPEKWNRIIGDWICIK